MDSNPTSYIRGQACRPLQTRLSRPGLLDPMFSSSLTASRDELIYLTSNYFPITTNTECRIYQYRVDFNPVQNKCIEKELLDANKKYLGIYIFHETMLFSNKKYESDIVKLSSKNDIDDKIVIITLKFISVIEKGDPTFIQILNLMLREYLSIFGLTQHGKVCYDTTEKIYVSNPKLTILPGYENTIGMFDNGLFLRSELIFKVIRQETVLDIFMECSKKKLIDPNWMLKFKEAVIGSVVLTIYNDRCYHIDNIDEQLGTESIFLKNDGSSISFKDFYKKKYHINLLKPQPMLISKRRKSFRIEGEETELVYLVPELCVMTGISNEMRKKKNMKYVDQHTIVNPTERIWKYNNFIERLLTPPWATQLLKHWNLTLSNQLIKITGRVMPQETIHGYNQNYLSDTTGNWTTKLSSLSMYSCAEILCWVIVTPYLRSADVGQFTNTLLKVANNMGLKLPIPKIVEIDDTDIRTYSIKLEQLINEINPSFILCVTLSRREDIYNIIKRKLCVDYAVPSQVVLLKQILKYNTIFCAKITIQINCKLGGAPWRVVIPESDMMIIGFNVCQARQNRKKFYGALIATTNNEHTSYFSCVESYENEQELSTSFATSITKALTRYAAINKKLPNTIVIYRDGVEDRQLSYVHKTEVKMVMEACKKFYGEKKVGLAFVIVRKYTSTRFLNNSENPPPGTVIDNSVTIPNMCDFYLVSQHVKVGTAAPTHYNVIVDTLNETATKQFTPKIMQSLTYKLTHMYYNQSSTIGIPAPCQLACQLAFLSAQSLQTYPNPGLEDLLHFL